MKTSTALEVKDDILLMLAGSKDVSKLKKVREAIAAILWSDIETDEQDEAADWWDELPEWQRARLRQIRQEIRSKSNQIPHTEAMNRLKASIYGGHLVK